MKYIKHIFFLVFLISLMANFLFAANQVVSNTNDTGAGSLRQAVADVGDGETITFSVTGTITLTSGEISVSGKSITITGPGISSLTVSGNSASRIFNVASSAGLTISNVTMTNGREGASHAGTILSAGTLDMRDCVISNGYASTSGGAIVTTGGSVTMYDCTISGNTANTSHGGAFFLLDTPNVSIFRSTFSSNSASSGIAGAIYFQNVTTGAITNSTFNGNSSQGGSAVTAESGSGVSISSSTISGNTASSEGGGIYSTGSSTITLKNTIVAGNTDSAGGDNPDMFLSSGTIASSGYNLIGDVGSINFSNNTTGDRYGDPDATTTANGGAIESATLIDPKLSALADNGGSTQTMALAADSPAIDNATATGIPTTDQRELTRKTSHDIGAFDLAAGASPTITSATYNVGTGVLAVTGENFEAALGAANDVDVSDLTFTGEGGETYTLTNSNDVEITNATSFSVTLSATDQEAVKMILNKNGTSSTGSTNYNLAAADDFITNVTAGDISDATNTVTVSGVANPTLSDATYNYNTNVLVVDGANFVKYTGGNNDVDVSAITLTGEAGNTYTLTTATDVEITSSTRFQLTVSSADVINVEHLLNKNSTQADDGTTNFNIGVADNWMRGTDAAANIADASGNAITVSSYAAPAVTNVAYNYGSNTFTVTGTNFVANPGANNDVDLSDITITGEGSQTYTLTTTSEVEITSATSLAFTISGNDIPEVEALLNNDGATSATAGTTYNLATLDNWMQGAAPNVNTAIASVGITVSNFANPVITSFAYNYNTNVLTATGTNFVKASGADNDVDISLLTFTGEGGATYTLTSASDIEISSSTEFSVTLSGMDLPNVEALLNKDGTQAADNTTNYNLAAADNWMTGSAEGLNIADATNPISVSAFANPAITNVAYNAGTGVFTVQGTNFVANSGADNDVDISLITITGEGNGTRVLTTTDVELTSAIEFSITLNAADKLAVNSLLNKNGAKSPDNTDYNFALADNWMTGSPAGNTITSATNAITVSAVPLPTITDADYDFSNNTLVVTGTNLIANAGANNDVDVSDFTITGEGGATYTLNSSSDVEITSATQFSIVLTGQDIYNVERLLNKNGLSAVSTETYNIAAAEDWLNGADGSADIVDLNGNGIDVSNYAAPEITNATYNFNTNQIVLDGTNFINNPGSNNDIDVSLLTFTGGNNATYTLTNTSDVELTTAIAATISLSAEDALNIRGLLNKNGAASSYLTTYNIAAAEDWMPGSPAAVDIADLSGNGITVSNVQVPTLSNATYDSDTGEFIVTGTNLFKNPGAVNDVDLSTITIVGGVGNATYRLITTTDVEITSATQFIFTVSGADKTNVDNLFDQLGTSSAGGSTYDIEGAEDWLTAADAATNIADSGPNAVTVTVNPKITSAQYNATTGTLVVTGSNIQANGGASDIDASDFTFTGETGDTYTLTNTADVNRTNINEFTITLSAADRAEVNQIINKDGTSSTGGTTYNLAAADDWCTNATAGNSADLTGNGITVSNVIKPTISNATYNFGTGVVVVTGANLVKRNGANNDIDVSLFTITGEGDAATKYTLTNTSDVEITSGTEFTFTLSAEDKAEVNKLINKNGLSSTSATNYNLAGADNWATGADAAVDVADETGNAVNASAVPVPAITSAQYDFQNGVLVVTGTDLPIKTGADNDIDASKFIFTGKGNATHTLTDTPDKDITSTTKFTLTLSSTDKAAVNALLDQTGTKASDNVTYNLGAAEDWAAGSAAGVNVADLAGNQITVGNTNQPPTSSDNSITINEDGEHTFRLSEFAYNDADGDEFTSLEILSNVQKGKLFIDKNSNGDVDAGELISNNSSVAKSYIESSKFKFISAVNEFGSPYANFTFKVSDGKENSTNTYTFTINVNSVVDAPVSADTSFTLIEDSLFSFNHKMFKYEDPENNSIEGIEIIKLPNKGRLKVGNNWILVETYLTNIQIDSMKFIPRENQNGMNFATFYFKVKNTAGIFSKDTNEVTMHVTPVNDKPVIAELPKIVFDEDSSFQLNYNELKPYISDVDNKWEELNLTLDCTEENLILTKLNDSTTVVSASENWFGECKINLKVEDSEDSVFSYFDVIVNSIDDPVDTTGFKDSLVVNFDTTDVINLYDLFNDPDTPDSLYTFEIICSNSSFRFEFDPITGELKIIYQDNNSSSSVGYSAYSAEEKVSVEVEIKIVVTSPNGEKTEYIFTLIVYNYTDIFSLNEIPNEYILSQNYPNPFNPSTYIEFGIPTESQVVVEVYNILGERIEVLVDEILSSGYHKILWDAEKNPSGIYFYRIIARSVEFSNEYIKTKKMLLVK